MAVQAGLTLPSTYIWILRLLVIDLALVGIEYIVRIV